eukprot:10799718-Alexandrium_andersonii.AAC.1
MLVAAPALPPRTASAVALLARHRVPGFLIPELDYVPVRAPGAFPAVPARNLVFCAARRAPPARGLRSLALPLLAVLR